MKPPEIRYARSSEVRIAYQVVGQGPPDLVFVPGFISNLEVHWEDPGYAHLLQRLSRFTRLIVLDKRGTGVSDRVDAHHLPSLETRMDDIRAVMDATGSGRAVLLGASEGAPMSILFAATYPERTRALILYGGYAHFHTWVMSREALAGFLKNAEESWGSGGSLPNFAPTRMDDPRFQAWWARFERLSASPGAAIALARMNEQIDVRVKVAGGRYLAEKIKGARYVELPGRDHPVWTGDIDRVVDEIEEFLTGARPLRDIDRVLATILVVRLVAPARVAAQIGDKPWSERITKLRNAAAETFERHGGRLAGSGAEEIVAHFDRPARAVRCALALRDAADSFKLKLAAGIHVGEIEIRDDAIAGLTVHVAGRIAARAGAGEVLVSSLVTDLVAGSGLHFEDLGPETVEGINTPLRLLAVVTYQHLQPSVRSPRGASLDMLSAREREVLDLVASGLSNAVIAGRLRLSGHTVKRHVANILLKLDLPTRAAAAALIGRPEQP